MSDFKFSCPHCDQRLEAPEEMIGQTVDCPVCNGKITIPQPEPTTQQPPEESPSHPAPPLPAEKTPLDVPSQSMQTEDGQTNKTVTGSHPLHARWTILGGSAAVVAAIILVSAWIFWPRGEERRFGGTPVSAAATIPKPSAGTVLPKAGKTPPVKEGSETGAGIHENFPVEPPPPNPIPEVKTPPQRIQANEGSSAAPIQVIGAELLSDTWEQNLGFSRSSCPRLTFSISLKNNGTEPIFLGRTLLLYDENRDGTGCVGYAVVTEGNDENPGLGEVNAGSSATGSANMPLAERIQQTFMQPRYGLIKIFNAGVTGSGSFLIIGKGAFMMGSSDFSNARSGPSWGTIPPGERLTIRAHFLMPILIQGRGKILLAGPIARTRTGKAWGGFWTFEETGEKKEKIFMSAEILSLAPDELIKACREKSRKIAEQVVLLNWLAETRNIEGASVFKEFLKGQGEESDLRKMALYGLGLAGDHSSIGDLQSIVPDSQKELKNRTAAAVALGWLEDPSSENILRPLLLHRAEQLRAAAAFSLPRLKGFNKSQLLIERLNDGNACPPAEEGLLMIKDRSSTIAQLVSALHSHPSISIRSKCVTILGRMNAGWDAIQDALKDKAENVRYASVNVLANADRITDPAMLIDALADYNTREAAGKALARWKDKDRAVNALTNALRHNDNKTIRKECVTILGRMNTGWDAIQDALKDKDKDVCRTSIVVLADADKITDPAMSIDALPDYQTREAAGKALARWKDKNRAVNALTDALRSNNNEHIRMECVTILGGMKTGWDAIRNALKDKSEYVRYYSFNVLANADKITDPAMLIDALPNYQTREAAGKALARWKDKDRAVNALTDALRSNNNEYTRMECVTILGGMKTGWNAIRDARKDKSENVRSIAFTVLANADRITDPAILIDALPNYQTREAAGKALARWKDKDRAVNALTNALRHNDNKTIRKECVTILGRMNTGWDAIQDALKDKEDEVRSASFIALADADKITDMSVLTDALADSQTRDIARKALLRLKDKDRAVNALTNALRGNERKEVRQECIAILVGMKAGREALKASLEDRELSVRTEALKSLAAVSTEKDVDFFVNLMKNSPDKNLRSAAVEALRILGSPKGLPPLVDALGSNTLGSDAKTALKAFPQRLAMVIVVSLSAREHKDPKVRLACIDLLSEEVANASVDIFANALKDSDADIRCNAAIAMKEGIRYRHVPPLLAALNDNNEKVRAAAVETLASCEDFNDPAPIVKLLKDPSVLCRKKAVETLGRLGNAAGIPALVSALANKGTAGEAETALGKITDRVAVSTALSELLSSHKDAAVRIACIKVLGSLNIEPAFPPLEEASRDPDASIAKAAKDALKKYTGN